MVKIAYQGIPGSFSYDAAITYFSHSYQIEECNLVGTQSFEKLFEEVVSTDCLGIVPLENTVAGSVYENYELLSKYGVTIIGEVILPINHMLLVANEFITIDDLQKIYSHPKALEQCTQLLQQLSRLRKSKGEEEIEVISAISTADAARLVADSQDRTAGAIASQKAGDRYGLATIRSNIEDHAANFTRFVAITANNRLNTSASTDLDSKCSLAVVLKHEAGSLLEFLRILANHGANMTKIESHPIVGSPFEYQFFIDFKVAEREEALIRELLLKSVSIKVLGWYQEATTINPGLTAE